MLCEKIEIIFCFIKLQFLILYIYILLLPIGHWVVLYRKTLKGVWRCKYILFNNNCNNHAYKQVTGHWTIIGYNQKRVC